MRHSEHRAYLERAVRDGDASARTLAAGRSDVALLSIPDLPIGQSISRFVEELAAALAKHGLTPVTHLAGAHGRPLPDVCASVDASVVIGFDPFGPETVQALYRAGADVVLPADDSETPPVTGEIGRLQVEHLIERGHRRLGYAMPAHPGLRRMAEARLRSAVAACTAAGLAAPVVASTNLEIAGAAAAVTQWTDSAVTGVCAFNDETAIAVLAGPARAQSRRSRRPRRHRRRRHPHRAPDDPAAHHRLLRPPRSRPAARRSSRGEPVWQRTAHHPRTDRPQSHPTLIHVSAAADQLRRRRGSLWPHAHHRH
jgi:hypothetical protein